MIAVVRFWASFYSIVCISVVYAKAPEEIVAGFQVNIEEYPYQVSLRVHNQHICGGSILDHFHILTAASCVVLENGVFQTNIKVLSGTSDQRDFLNGQIHDVAVIVIHEDYDPKNFWRNDIAILKLSRSLPFSRSTRPIPPLRWNRIYGLATVTGWGGADSPMNSSTRYLQAIQIRVETTVTCRLLYSEYSVLHNNQKCGILSEESAVSKGDGGSPLTSRGKVIGFLSLSQLYHGAPAIFTKIHPYSEWIDSYISIY